MKRLLAIAAVLRRRRGAASSSAPARGDDGGDLPASARSSTNAFSVIPGEDVKIAGVKVGKIESLDVTPDQQGRGRPAHRPSPASTTSARDAECTIRPQSLIGEKFVECTPTQPRPEGAPAAAAAAQDRARRGRGPVPAAGRRRRRKPVDLDLRQQHHCACPTAQRLAIILNELGTGLAGRGGDLRQAIRNADPALKETDKVLADPRRPEPRARRPGRATATRSSRPLARDRGAGRRLRRARRARRREATRRAPRATSSRTSSKLPAFLRELRADDAAPRRASPTRRRRCSPTSARRRPTINRFIERARARSRRPAIPALESLGDAADVGRQALVKSQADRRRPRRSFADDGASRWPTNLAALLTSAAATPAASSA